jgi:hypothetical protein
MMPGRARVFDDDGAVSEPTDGDGILADVDSSPVWKYQTSNRGVVTFNQRSGDVEGALWCVCPTFDGYLDRSDERVFLCSSVLSRGVHQLLSENVDESSEAVEVLGGQDDMKGIGRDDAADCNASLQIHLASEASAKLDRL